MPRRGGRESRDKGNRAERVLVRFLQERGYAAERTPLSGSAGGRLSGDISLPLLGVDRTVEVKCRANGFRALYKWLKPMRLATEIAQAAERRPGRCAVNARARLPSRRQSESFAIELHGLRFLVTYSRFADGRLAEVFLQNHKHESQSDANARDSAVGASLALQYGCPLEVLQRAVLRDHRCRPSTPLGAALDLLAVEGTP